MLSKNFKLNPEDRRFTMCKSRTKIEEFLWVSTLQTVATTSKTVNGGA